MNELGECTTEKKHEQIYYTAVRVRAKDAGGSGICIYSDYDKMGRARTFVVTNHHVVDGLIEVEKKWDATLKREYPQEETESADVEFFSYNNYSAAVGSDTFQADILAYDHADKRDIALLELREQEKTMDHVAKLYPKKICRNIYMFDRVYAVGAGLGVPCFQTPGEVTNARYEIKGQPFIGTNAAITFGNSGGGLFKAGNDGDYYLIGLPARVSMQGWGDVANHIGFAIPIEQIYEFLDDNCLEFVYDDDHEIEECMERLQERRERAKGRLLGESFDTESEKRVPHKGKEEQDENEQED